MKYCKSVTLRTKKLAHGKLSYYLDYYPGYRNHDTMKVMRHEFIGIYIWEKPKDKQQRLYNKEMAKKAEYVRCQRYEAILNERLGIIDPKALKGDFLAYYEKVTATKNPKWQFVFAHFKNFVQGKCSFEEVDVDLCRKFQDYLLNAKGLATGEPLAQNSIAGYWSTFRGMLRIAYRDRMIRENVNDFLDRINTVEAPKETLSLDELKKLYQTPCDIDVLRCAALFSCLTGLRRSDIMALEWKNVMTYTDGGHYLDFTAVKTRRENIVPISNEAYALLGEERKGLVFVGLKREMTYAPMKEWIKKAGITKKITFHCFRHTYASLQIELGTDPYTVQKLLAHRSIGTTEIYTRHADPKKREAADKICLGMLNDDSGTKKGGKKKKS